MFILMPFEIDVINDEFTLFKCLLTALLAKQVIRM